MPSRPWRGTVVEMSEPVRTSDSLLSPSPSLTRLRANEIGGRDYAAGRSAEMDARLAALAKEIFEGAPDVALVALGGYGRGELCPFSDVDLLFLVSENAPESTAHGVEKFLYALWDSGVRVGHAVRSAHECANAARADIKVWTTLLDARLIHGPEDLFAELLRTVEALRTPEAVRA